MFLYFIFGHSKKVNIALPELYDYDWFKIDTSYQVSMKSPASNIVFEAYLEK